MHFVDYIIFTLYMAGILWIGWYHFCRNRSDDDYYVGGRSIPPTPLGLSIVATDVGGGFSIGLGGVGFMMGLSGSWLLFTGLVGAWLTAIFIIPRIKGPDLERKMLTYPDFLRHRYGHRTALLAAVISAIGYLMFTGSQIRAGATLASETVLRTVPFGFDPFLFSLYAMAAVIVVYTVMGGIKAVIYTDFVQWMILLSGLCFLAAPLALRSVGGWASLRATLPDDFFSVTAIAPVQFINWMVAIVPIWLVGMTLYQRMYAARNAADARKAWYIAGLFEYPVMAFAGVFLGMCARALYPELLEIDGGQELGLPRLINEVLPIGVTGVVAAAYFSAIMSTADSTLVASSGNLTGDLLYRYVLKRTSHKAAVRLSQLVTLILGLIAVYYAQRFSTVIEGVFDAYGFLVAGLFVPTLGAFFWKRGTACGAVAGIVTGGLVANVLPVLDGRLPGALQTFFFGLGLWPVVYGLVASAVAYVAGSLLSAPPDGCANEGMRAGGGDS